MRKFIHDMIHMTEGEKLINYWWLWLAIGLLALLGSFIWNEFKRPRKR